MSVMQNSGKIISFVNFGARVSIQTDNPATVEKIITLLPIGSELLKNQSPPDVFYSVKTCGDHSLFRTRNHHSKEVLIKKGFDQDTILNLLESDLHFQVACNARTALFVHAGVVSLDDRAIMIPGRSFSGKTTLIKSLVQAGATYYSDEYAPIDSTGRIHPYPKSLSIRNEEKQTVSKISVEKLGGEQGLKPIPLKMVIVSQYKHDSLWNPIQISPGEIVMSLIDNTVLARTRSRHMLKIFAQTVQGAAGFKGVRGEAEDVSHWLSKQLLHDKASNEG